MDYLFKSVLHSSINDKKIKWCEKLNHQNTLKWNVSKYNAMYV